MRMLGTEKKLESNRTVLEKLGFQNLGIFVLKNNELNIATSGVITNDNGIYAFIEKEAVKCIGETERGFLSRLSSFLTPGPRQKTNIRIKKEIEKTLSEGKTVEFWFLSENEVERLGCIKIVEINAEFDLTRKMLERILIEHLEPIWNLD